MNANAYSRVDRLLHELAFRGVELQKSVADIEDRLYGASLAGVRVERPIFVTSLPRAGTTLLLEILSRLPNCVTHTYRNMPFVLCPLLWGAMSGRFRKPGVAHERAHGDGVQVNFDSPEAFEEVLWMAFWPEKYGRDHISPWDEDEDAEDFDTFFARHMSKLALSSGGPQAASRYLSKNNANVARLPLLSKMFPDCAIVVPFRHPRDQAASLLEQHRRFSLLHAEDAFAKRYMQSIGHLEFGALLKPIRFAATPRTGVSADPGCIEFWLAYWTDVFAHVLRHGGPNVKFLEYEALCERPRSSLAALGDAIDEPDLVAAAGPGDTGFHRARRYEGVWDCCAPEAIARAEALHEALQARAINR